MANFNIHASRRFGAAETVYAKVRIAHGAVVGLFGVAQVPTFEEYNRADLNGYLKSRDVPEGMRLRILGLWDNNRQEALGLLRDYLRRLDVAESQNELSAAQNEAFLNELYLSDEATAALQELFSMLWDWIYVAQNPDHGLSFLTSMPQAFSRACLT